MHGIDPFSLSPPFSPFVSPSLEMVSKGRERLKGKEFIDMVRYLGR